MVQRANIKTNEEAADVGWEIAFGDADASGGEGWVLVQKAWLSDDHSRTHHTTKRMVVPGGWLYETQTTIYLGRRVGLGHEGFTADSVSTSKALGLVPFADPESTVGDK